MAGISNCAAGGVANKKKYNGIDHQDDLGLNEYDAFFRDLDAQTGRWWQIDPVTDSYEDISPYASMYNDPMRYSDPLGDEGETCCKDEIIGAVNDLLISASGVVNGMLNTGSFGLIPTDPFNFRHKLTGDQITLYDNSVKVGQIGPLLMPGGEISVETPSLKLVNGPALPVAATLKPVLVPISSSTEGNKNKNQKSSNDKLIEEAKAQKDKDQKAQQRQQNREQASSQGKKKQGKSNQETRGDHNNTSGGGGKAKKNDHENANARRAREQKAADEKKQRR